MSWAEKIGKKQAYLDSEAEWRERRVPSLYWVAAPVSVHLRGEERDAQRLDDDPKS